MLNWKVGVQRRRLVASLVGSAVLVSTVFGVSGGVSASAAAQSHGIAGKTIMLQFYTAPDTPFWVPAITGAKAAAKMLGVNLDIEYTNASDATQVSQINIAVAKKDLGIATTLPDNASETAVCAAQAAGVPVVTFNVDGLTGKKANCAEAFIGQDFVQAGSVIAQRMVNDGLIKKGEHFVCPVEAPTAVYAVQRYAGVMKVLRPLGVSCDLIGVGTDAAAALSTMVQYLLGKPNTTGIVALGAVPLTEAVAAAKQVKKPNMPIGGFDLAPTILSGIASGKIDATVDQQPYSQGFYAVMELGLQAKYQLFPSSMATGGLGLVDKSNVKKVESLVPTYR
jgi:simple sugar transport system substrate-binding protein